MYEINNLTFRYMLSDRNSLEQVLLKIKKGKITLIAGPSGSGKTTLLRHLKKELLPKGKRSGKVLYDGQEIEQLKDLQSVKEVGYLFQNPSAQMVMDTVWHEIAFGLENLGMPYEQMKRTVAEIVNYFDLQKIYHEDTDKLSGGQKQLVNLAAVMAMHPKVLILDEPTSGLDPGERVRFRNLLSEFAKDRIVVISTHIVSDVEYIANQNAIMKDGKIIENDTTEQLVRLVDGKIWECKIPSSDLVKWERALKLINLRNEADGTTSIRYLSDQAETPDSVSAVPRLEDLYLWLFPQEGEVRL